MTTSLRTADAAYELQQELAAAAVVAARAGYTRGPEYVAQLVAAYQLYAAQAGAASVAPMLAEQGLSQAAVAAVAATALAGLASDGRGLVSLFEQALSVAQLALMVATQVQDAGRVAAGLQVVASPAADGYVRMLNPPSCSRCVILAGKFYKWNAGFERHPLCDCRHIPASEATEGDLRINPHAYFESLSPADQDSLFTQAGAQAIRDGADIFQVVNARRGMSTAAMFGRTVSHTFEGVTRRGIARKAMGSGRPIRLMPESIYEHATSREDAIRLLKLYGYLL